MRYILFLFLLFFSGLCQSQERFFEKAIKKGRQTARLYNVEIKDGSVVKRTILKKFSNEYILRNVETQSVNRFGDRYEGVKSFDFLPVREIFHYVYDNKLIPELSNYQSGFRQFIKGGKKAGLYFYDTQNNGFNHFKDFLWSGEIQNGLVAGTGIGIYYSEYNGIALAVKGNFKNGILNGNGTFISYKFDDLAVFDSGKITNQTVSLSGFVDGMAALTIDNHKGFVNEQMLVQINPQYRQVLQEFKEGRAMVVNEKDEEVYIDKAGNFIEYTARQKQVFEEQKKADETRRQAIIENDIRTEFIEAVNSDIENRLLLFYQKYHESEYSFARKYAMDALDKANAKSLAYEVPFKEAAYSHQGERLVKMIISSKDGTPVTIGAQTLYNFTDDQYIERDTIVYLTQVPGNGKKLFTALEKPVSFLDKSVINGTWYDSADDPSDSAWMSDSGFGIFKNVLSGFAHDNGMIVRYMEYWGDVEIDTVRHMKERETIHKFLFNNCARAEIESAENPGGSTSATATGTIKMKSGETYTWMYDGENFTMRVSWMDGTFSSFPALIENFREECQKRFCGSDQVSR